MWHPLDEDTLTTEEKIWDLTMQINLKGIWWGHKYAIQAMRKKPFNAELGLKIGGCIVNTASFVAITGAATPQLACEAHVCYLSEACLLSKLECDRYCF